MNYTDDEKQLLKHYADYIDQLRGCKTGEQQKNLQLMWEAVFRTMNSTLEDVKALKGKIWLEILKKAFSACFEEPQDQTAFEIKHPVKIKTAENWAQLDVEEGQSYDDYPGQIIVSSYGATFSWKQKVGSNNWPLLHRDIGNGPAMVDIRNDGHYRGCHFINGDAVTGHKNWRKRCAQHNHWIARIKST